MFNLSKERNKMKKTFAPMIAMALATGIAMNGMAKAEKKNPPKSTRAVVDALKEVGGEHYPEKMKVSSKMPVEVGETYYHCYTGTLRKGGYRIIIFDNTPQYLGFYNCEYEPCDYEEGALMLDSGESDDDGNQLTYTVSIPRKGPSSKISIDGVVSPFVKNPKLEEKKGDATTTAAGPAKVATKDGKELVPEYREWTIRMKGREIKFTAIYIKKSGSKVTLKEQKRGKENDFSIAALSKEDQAYLKQFK